MAVGSLLTSQVGLFQSTGQESSIIYNSQLKALGNDAAHVEAKTYDTIDEGEAADSIELAKEILKARYQLKGLVERLQARKKKNPTRA